jgi:hypothetical protein
MSKTRPEFGVTVPITGLPPHRAAFAHSNEQLQGRDELRTPLRLRRCMMLQYDPVERKWRDILHQTRRRTPVAERVEQKVAAPVVRVANTDTTIHPVILGLCLTLCPPLGVTLAWTSTTLPHEGKVALTFFGGFVLTITTVVAALVALT